MNQKRGQFFILAAVIIVSVIVGISVYSNKVLFQDSRGGVYSLKQEVSQETSNVIDYGLYKRDDKLEDFIQKMSGNLLERESSGLDLIFFYGNSSQLNVLNLGEENLTMSHGTPPTTTIIPGVKKNVTAQVSLGGVGVGINIDLIKLRAENLIKTIALNVAGDKISFKVNEAGFDLPLNSNKDFYFVIKREVGEELYVTTG
jgi:hypothetical protein